MPIQAHSIIGSKNDGKRPHLDFYPTPQNGTLALLKYESFIGDIWEPACGDGSMSKVLEYSGYNVISTDIEPRNYGTQGDFFSFNHLLAPNIITNPPFKFAQEFASHALSLNCESLAMLCKLAFLESEKRGNWLSTTPLKNVYVFSKRLTMTRNGEPQTGSGMIAFAWYVWRRDYCGKPMIGWI